MSEADMRVIGSKAIAKALLEHDVNPEITAHVLDAYHTAVYIETRSKTKGPHSK